MASSMERFADLGEAEIKKLLEEIDYKKSSDLRRVSMRKEVWPSQYIIVVPFSAASRLRESEIFTNK
jgi:hypothetical protein